ncbi:MAG: hypothetical protein J6U10_03795, partial [Lachnospiraceae bacterium]|nr:hypothetical protein [Lachnospiraceae bacterium]
VVKIAIRAGACVLAAVFMLIGALPHRTAITDHISKVLKQADKPGEVKSLDRTDTTERDIILSHWVSQYVEAGDLDKAKECFEAMTYHDTSEYYIAATSISAAEDDYKKTAEYYTEAATKYPEDYAFQLLAGYSAILTEKFETARFYLDRALVLASDPCDSTLGLAIAHAGMNDPATAQKYLVYAKLYADKGYGRKDIKEGIEEVTEYIKTAKEGSLDGWVEKWMK